jgi:tetratricopeptide (TPR) repeat protein
MEQGTNLGLSLGMTPQQVATKLGQPTNQKIDTLGGYAYYAPQKLYVYYDVPTVGAAAAVSGWKFFPNTVPEFVAETPWPIHIAPYQFLGVEAFRAGESDKSRYNDALNYLKMAAKLDPGNQDIQQLISETYVNSGRIAEARAALEAQIRQNPGDPSLYITYGNLLFQAKDYNGAAQNFQKVVDLNLDKTNPNLAIALFNLAAVYKNRGAELQDSIRSAIGPTTSPTAAQIEIFRKPLRQAAKYFEQLKTNGRDKDFTLLAELGNVYDVLGEKEKVKQMLNEIVALKNVAGNQNNANYWSTLSRFYAIMGDVKNAEDADRKATELSK